MAKLNVNGRMRDVQAEADTPLLWVIREQVQADIDRLNPALRKPRPR